LAIPIPLPPSDNAVVLSEPLIVYVAFAFPVTVNSPAKETALITKDAKTAIVIFCYFHVVSFLF